MRYILCLCVFFCAIGVWGADAIPAIGLGPAPGISSGTTAGGDLTGTYPNPTIAGISAGTLPIITSLGTITTAIPMFSGTATWNAAGTTFYGAQLNITNSASAAGSYPIQVNVGGSEVFHVSLTGGVTAAATIQSNNGNLISSSASGAATIQLLSAAGNSSAVIFNTNATNRQQIIGNSADWYLQDLVNAWIPIEYAMGASSAGTVTFAGTLDATSTTAAAVIISGGEAVAKKAYFGSQVNILTGNLNITTSTANGTTASVLTATTGPTGASTGEVGWITIEVAGTAHYIPYW